MRRHERAPSFQTPRICSCLFDGRLVPSEDAEERAIGETVRCLCAFNLPSEDRL